MFTRPGTSSMDKSSISGNRWYPGNLARPASTEVTGHQDPERMLSARPGKNRVKASVWRKKNAEIHHPKVVCHGYFMAISWLFHGYFHIFSSFWRLVSFAKPRHASNESPKNRFPKCSGQVPGVEWVETVQDGLLGICYIAMKNG